MEIVKKENIITMTMLNLTDFPLACCSLNNTDQYIRSILSKRLVLINMYLDTNKI